MCEWVEKKTGEDTRSQTIEVSSKSELVVWVKPKAKGVAITQSRSGSEYWSLGLDEQSSNVEIRVNKNSN